jgi:WhiB family redox-sensing transcriptional regulator
MQQLPVNMPMRTSSPWSGFAVGTEWMDQANCVGTDPEAWFPGKGGRVSGVQRAVCRNCEVSAQCLAYALERGCGGIWGGKTERERRLIKREIMSENTD